MKKKIFSIFANEGLIFVLTLFSWAVCFFTPFLFSNGKTINTPIDRQVTLQKVLEIKETDESFYFKYPSRIYADLQENVYVLDSNRVLKFSKNGDFIKSLVNTGQGPGEVTFISNLYLIGDRIIIHNNNPSKIIRINKNGDLKKEFRLENTNWVNFSHYY
ncbi:MAG: 6-bladed beta-propeller, partial [Candidatus Aminicenantes bacterium]